MKTLFYIMLIFTAPSAFAIAQIADNESKSLTDSNEKFWGQDVPGMIPQIFHMPAASPSESLTGGLAISPGNTEIYFSVFDRDKLTKRILGANFVNEEWTPPVTANFSGVYNDDGPVFSPDGNRIYFNSNRPVSVHSKEEGSTNIWFIQKDKLLWGYPQKLPKQINTYAAEIIERIDDDKLFFSRYDSTFKRRLYQIRLNEVNKNESKLIKDFPDPETFFEPPQIEGVSFYIFTRKNNLQNNGYPELFISFKNPNDSWTIPKSMGDMINNGGAEFPRLSPEGRFLFFLSRRSGRAEYYWVDAGIIDFLKLENFKLTELLYESILEENITYTKNLYFTCKQKYSQHYKFEESLLNEVAEKLLLKGENEKAIEIYNFNFELYPANRFYPQKLTIALMQNNEEVFLDLLAKIKSDPVYHKLLEEKLNQLGERLLSMNKISLALKTFILNTELNPNSSWPYFRLANAYQKLNYKKAAIENYRKAIGIDPGNKYAEARLKSLSTK